MYVFGIFTIISCIGGVSTEGFITLLAPELIRPDSNYTVNLFVANASSELEINATLTIRNGSTALLSRTKTLEKGFTWASISVNVPNTLGPGSYSMEFRIVGSYNHTLASQIQYLQRGISILIQTDRAIYMTGQTVNYRLMAADMYFKVIDVPLTVEIRDSRNNILYFNRNMEGTKGIITGSYLLAGDLAIGDWKLIASKGIHKETRIFRVEPYQSPEFYVEFETEPVVSSDASSVKGSVIARYTYGRTVDGTLELYVYRFRNDFLFNVTLPIQGRREWEIQVSEYTQLAGDLNNQMFTFVAKVTEKETAVTRNASVEVLFMKYNYNLEILNRVELLYKPAFHHSVTVLVKQQNGDKLENPMPSGFDLNVTIAFVNNGPEKQRKETMMQIPIGSEGRVVIPINDIPPNSDIYLQVRLVRGSDFIAITFANYAEFKSPSRTYMQVQLLGYAEIGKTANFEINSTTNLVEVSYQVLSRWIIVQSGILDMENKTILEFGIKIKPEMAPRSYVIVTYVRHDGEIIDAMVEFHVQPLFLDEEAPSVEFRNPREPVDEDITIDVTADPNSDVYVVAVDQSVAEHDNDINNYMVSRIIDADDFKLQPFPRYIQRHTAVLDLQDIGLVVLQRKLGEQDGPSMPLKLENPKFLPTVPPEKDNSVYTFSTTAIPNFPYWIYIRKKTVFPRTWIFSKTSMGINGKGVINVTVPSPFTTWVANCFSINTSSSIRAARTPVQFSTFSKFFMEVKLPESVILEEHVVIHVTVFNYFRKRLNVTIQMPASQLYKPLEVLQEGDTRIIEERCSVITKCIMVGAKAREEVSLAIVPVKTGKLEISLHATSALAQDKVVKLISVEPKGVPRKFVKNLPVDLVRFPGIDESVEIVFEPDAAEGSEKLNVHITGDPLALIMESLDNLVDVPEGTGEQILLKVAPSVYLLKHISSKGKLTDKLREKLLLNINLGIQRQTQYQRDWGVWYSAFGNNDTAGSTWVTSMVVRSLAMASRYTYVARRSITHPLTWILAQQNTDGGFSELASRFPWSRLDTSGTTSRPSQGTDRMNSRAFTASILICLLEVNNSVSLQDKVKSDLERAIENAVNHLKSGLKYESNLYALAITSYVLTLVGSSAGNISLALLEKEAIVTLDHKYGNTTHWSPSGGNSSKVFAVSSPAIDIETSAYVLLKYVLDGDIANARMVQLWLLEQLSPKGGFLSIQDTVVGLQALTAAAELLSDTVNKVNVKVAHVGFRKRHQMFVVSDKNSFLVQRKMLPLDTMKVRVHAWRDAESRVFVQIILSYNIFRPTSNGYTLDVKTTSVTLSRFMVEICTRSLRDGTSGLSIIEIGIPSGFRADLWTVTQHDYLKKAESTARKVILYMSMIPETATCLSVYMLRAAAVAALKPVPCRVYDYYDPSIEATQYYLPHVLKYSDICHVGCTWCGCKANDTMRTSCHN